MLGRLLIAFICSFALVSCGEDKPEFVSLNGPERAFVEELGTPVDEQKATITIGYGICNIHENVSNPQRRHKLIHEDSVLEPEQVEAIEDAALEHLC